MSLINNHLLSPYFAERIADLEESIEHSSVSENQLRAETEVIAESLKCYASGASVERVRLLVEVEEVQASVEHSDPSSQQVASGEPEWCLRARVSEESECWRKTEKRAAGYWTKSLESVGQIRSRVSGQICTSEVVPCQIIRYSSIAQNNTPYKGRAEQRERGTAEQ